MGGNALKAFGVERKSKKEYLQISSQLTQRFSLLFPNNTHALIEAYADKQTFGDADLLVGTSNLPSDWLKIVEEHFKPTAFVHNGDVHSLDYQKLQIDLITVPQEAFLFAQHYFSFNDLGNLMGRCAHKMGFKLGHLGLFYPLRENDHQIAQILITQDPKQAFEFLGYSYERYKQGFRSLEDIFQYTASSPYFSSEIFLLHNRNAKSRVRDAKRPTYNSFLQWVEQHNPASRMVWHTQEDLKQQQKQGFLEKALHAFPLFEQRYQLVLANYAEKKRIEQKFNGQKVRQWTNLEGPTLGLFMQQLKSHPQFSQRVEQLEETQIEQWVHEEHIKFQASPLPNIKRTIS